MKRLFVVILLALSVLLSACGPSEADCELNKQQLNKLQGRAMYDAIPALEITLILNSEYPPDSLGFMLKDCIDNGWDFR